MAGLTLITGANGFVGRALAAELIQNGTSIRGVVRNSAVAETLHFPTVIVDDIGPSTDWSTALEGIETIIHLAARVHVMDDKAVNPLAEFRRVNTAGTEHLARCAATAGVKRLVFLSSIKVNGEETVIGKPYTEDDAPSPMGPYGVSKYEAEVKLRQCANETGLEVVIIRPVLVYGPRVKGNFRAMMRWLYKGVPLPFGKIYNQRSFVALDNLIDMIITCLYHQNAANQTFLVSDGDDVSTTQLLRNIALALGKDARIFPAPVWWLRVVLTLFGKRKVAQRLFGSLQVDIAKARELLGWTPIVTMNVALRATTREFLASNAR